MKRNGKALHPEQPKSVSAFPLHWKNEWDWAYSEAVYPTLARRYPNRWIALAHHQVIAAGTNVMKVLAQAHKKVAWKEVPLVFVERGIHVYLLDPAPPLHGD